MARTRITGATVVTPSETLVADVVFDSDSGAILDVGSAPSQSAATAADLTVDARGLHLIPGVVDHHVHFREPGLTHKEDLRSGSIACAKGGVTSFIDMPNTVPHAVDQAGLDAKLDAASRKSIVNYGFYIGATPTNTDALAAADRAAGIKVFIGSSTGMLLVDEQDDLERIFAATTLPICAHCEDEATVRDNFARLEAEGFPGGVADHSRVRDHAAALVCTRRAIDLAVRHNHRFHVLHVSTADELPLIHAARGIVTAEACPHHLFFNTDDYARLGTRVQMNPAIKSAQDSAALFDALLDGTLHVVATDHAPHTLEEKAQPYPKSPSGLPAVENALSLMLDQVAKGRCTLEQVVDWMCLGPAQTWDILDKGRIEPGAHADLVLVDLQRRHTVLDEKQLTKAKWSPWHGVTLTGRPVRTFVMGREVSRYDPDADIDHIDTSTPGRELAYDHALGGYWAHRSL